MLEREILRELYKMNINLESIISVLKEGQEMSKKITDDNRAEGVKMEGELKGLMEGIAVQFKGSHNKEVMHG